MGPKQIDLTAAEWSVMECLWEGAPRTGQEVSQLMAERCGWSRSTTLTLLGRMEAKGAVAGEPGEGKRKRFLPLVSREDAAAGETEDFLDRVYKGSVSMMVSALTRKQSLSQAEIDELYAILKDLEENKNA